MNRNYAIVVYPFNTDKGVQWCAEFPDVKGCVGGGNTAEEAVREAYENLDFYLDSLAELGLPVPPANYKANEDYSGKYVVRMSKSLHRDVALMSEAEGISMNSFIVEAIAEKIGRQRN